MNRSLGLAVVCLNPPNPELLNSEMGLQEKSAAKAWQLQPGEWTPEGNLVFRCTCKVQPAKADGSPDFSGSFVHGTAGARFLYISWRPKVWTPALAEPRAPQYVRRMKIHLRGITWELLDRLPESATLITTVEGRAKDGCMACASVPLLGGWQVSNSSPQD